MWENKNLSAITETDLRALIESRIGEGKRIDYKRDLPGSSDADRKEFLFDVSSFANTSGGHLIYGIAEENGIPQELTGLAVADTDKELRRLQSLILDGIEPRIQGTDLRFVPISETRHALVIAVPQSWRPPHMVIFQRTNKFYGRNSGGKQLLDVEELRSLYLLPNSIAERVKNFRIDRLAKIIGDEAPVPLGNGPKTILHLFPLQSLLSPTSLSLVVAQQNGSDLFPLGSSGYNPQINLDGVLRTANNSYLQLFRNGTIETVNSSIIELNGNMKLIPSTVFEQAIINSITRYLSFLGKIGINPPFVVMLTLTGVKDYGMAINRPSFGASNKIDRDTLVIPEAILETFEVSANDLRPMLDLVWNAAGFTSKPYSDI